MTKHHDSSLRARSAFADLPVAAIAGAGVTVSDRSGLEIATLLVRKGARSTLSARLREYFQIDLPQGPRRTAAGSLALAGTGPGAWLATFERGGNSFAQHLGDVAAGVASVSDQSDGYAVLRLTGPRARDALSRLIPIDLHPSVFAVGNVSVSVSSYMGVTLWRLDDDVDGSSRFEIAVARSMALSLWQALHDGAAQFGISVTEGV